jgi:DNA invertase Pin-like site-specific DNA recombinase
MSGRRIARARATSHDRRSKAISGNPEARGVDLVVLDQGVDTSTRAGRMLFQILGAIAEFEQP